MLTPTEVRDLLATSGATDVDELIGMLHAYLDRAPTETRSHLSSELPAAMTPKVLADVLATTPTTLQRWRDDGTGPPFVRLPGTRLIRYLREDVLAWLDSGRQATR